jgi:hypothetical protein
MDPNTTPSRTTEETTRSRGQTGEQSVTTKRTEGPTQVAHEQVTEAMSPTGDTLRREQAIGLSPAAAHEYTRKKEIFRAYQIIWYLLGLIEIILAFRFFLKLAGANPNSGFASFIYGLSQPAAGPFLETFRATPNPGAETTSFFEWSTLVAAMVYALVAWGIIKLFQFSKPTKPEEIERSLADE